MKSDWGIHAFYIYAGVEAFGDEKGVDIFDYFLCFGIMF